MRRRIGTVFAAVALILLGEESVGAQPASPGASAQVGSCAVEPRTEADLVRLAALAGTPDVGTPDASVEVPLDGETDEPETMRAIETTLAEVAACGATGDVARLLALYTDGYVVREALATEPVPIVPSVSGTPELAPVAGTPESVSASAIVLGARDLTDGRVAALVERDGRREIVIFAEIDGRWLIDATQAVRVDDGSEGSSPEAGVSDELAGLPPVRAAVADAAVVAGVEMGAVTVAAVEPAVWPDASLGCPEPGMFYAQVETAGYRVVLMVEGEDVRYHTDAGEGVVQCDDGG